MPLVKTREYRNLAILQPNFQQAEKRIDSENYVEGYAAVYDKPYEMYELSGIKYYEVIQRGALDGADMSDVILQYDHEGKVMARNSNQTLIVESDNYGLLVCADLSKSSAAKELYEEIESGLVTRMSWAFTVADEEYDKETRTRIIKRVKKVYDVSAVSIPANDDTEISARSFVNGVIEQEKRESLEQRKKKLKLKLLLEGN